MDNLNYWRPQQREKLWDMLESGKHVWDLVIVGGGVTGAGVLREAVRYGLKALLVEKRDFAWGASSKSSKMVHGGLRYLASGQLSLTRHSVRERQRLLEEAPGLVEPLNFLMGHYRGEFPPGFIFQRVLDVYDRMAGARNHEAFAPEQAAYLAPGINAEGLRSLSRFGDAVTDDARLVLKILRQGVAEGGVAVNYCGAREIVRVNGRLHGVVLHDAIADRNCEVRARVVVNATGAWSDQLRMQEGVDAQIRPLRGSHLVLPHWRLPVAYAVSGFHPEDKRPVFAFPWEGVTVVGTTDLDHTQDMEQDVSISVAEMDYLMRGVNHMFPSLRLQPEEVMCTYSGIRPVVSSGAADPSKEKREHSIWNDNGLISVAGGKLTTFRLIALDVLQEAARYLDGVAFNASDARVFASGAPPYSPDCGVSASAYRRLCGRYGAAGACMLEKDKERLRPITGTNLLWGEIDHALQNESVVHLDDLMLRRTRLGLLAPNGAEAMLDEVGRRCQRYLGWSDAVWRDEANRYRNLFQRHFGVPGVTTSDDAARTQRKTEESGA
ncbi:Glycerol-3-phosphate dehydrogenase [Hahella chejuensis KCTC 2396]|uniref:Glycerol-3-phosphate dehydrogenase n=1 Tax=Hahella chejuensis (strain KCTC 2396) TaxID=349521 RepID=Q2SDF0_HAHCH|nr:glycerol-3-phosphate dehydrogenase/oxidase [Hahella chejuensis]ABC31324.1 Glycerol-3-phosphate dehydrogenase [Hahella chejuensis KCTC 2396]